MQIAVKVRLRARKPVAALRMRQSGQIGVLVVVVAAVSLALFLGVRAMTGAKTTEVAKRGEIVLEEELGGAEKDFLRAALGGVELATEVRIGKTEMMRRSSEAENQVLYEILVPVTDFYAGKGAVSEAEVQAAREAGTEVATGVVWMMPIQELTREMKLLAIEGEYFLDTFETGAVFRYYTLAGSEAQEVAKVRERLEVKIREEAGGFPSRETVFSLAQTGVTALARGMNARLKQIGEGNAAEFASQIGRYLSGFDKTHTSNEASFAEGAPAIRESMTICALPGMKSALTAIGLDIVELTGNHNQDCGDGAAAETIDWYKQNGIEVFGGGKTAEEAAKPLRLNEKGTGVTMLGYNLSTGGYTLDATPGANFYTEENAQAEIMAAKARGDFVIVDVQYYECGAYVNTAEDTTCDAADSAAGDQIGLFRHLVDLGADMVVGTSAHQPQTFELYGDGAIYYGLGNLFFDQSWWPGTRRSLVLASYLYQGRLLQTRVVPTMYGATYQPERMDVAGAEGFLERLGRGRP